MTKIDFENVYVTKLTDDSDGINAKLAQGLDVIISPGIYYLKTSLRVTRSDQVILGLNVNPVTTSDQPCIVVPDNLDGVRIAGLLLEAKSETVSFYSCGESQEVAILNPGVMSDVFARNGVFTTETVSVRSIRWFVLRVIPSSSTILWLWRADHDTN